jgi:uncharacterized lipoprotein YbaY/heat shock protein HslJ
MKTRWISLALSVSAGIIGLVTPAMAQNTANSSTPNFPEHIDDLENTEWLLEDLGGSGVVDRVQTTIRFGDDDRITGTGGCNRYFAGIEREGDRLSVGVIGSTRMLCPPAVMDQEDRFFQAIEAAQTLRLDGPFLYIDSEGLEQPLRFTQIRDADAAANISDSAQTVAIAFEDTLQLFHAGDYAVRVFRQGDGLTMNLFNTQTNTLELNGAAVSREPNPEGTDFTYRGDRTVKVFVSHRSNQQLVINDEWQRNTDANTAETLEGTVTYLQRIALSPDAVMEVRLLDVSRQGAPAEILAAVNVPTVGQQVPLAFQLAYNPDQIQPNHTYSIQARILVDGELQFISTSINPAFSDGADEPIEIRVDPVSAP